MTAFADLVRAGKVLYIGVSEWRAEEIAAGAALARDLGVQLISNQPQYSMLWRVIEDEVVPTSAKEGVSQIVWSPLAQGVLTGKYLPGQQPPADSRGGHAEAGRIDAAAAHRRHPHPGPAAASDRRRPRPDHGPARARLGAAEPERRRRDHRRHAARSRCTTTSRPPASGWTTTSLQRIDEALGDVVERDPAKTARG